MQSSGDWRGLAVTLKGTTKGRDEECQDQAAWWELADGCVALAVADGAGSAIRGGDGARRLVSNAASAVLDLDTFLLVERGPDDVLRLLEQVVVDVVLQTRLSLERATGSTRDYASTFGLVLITPACIAAGVIGDAFVCVRHAGEKENVHLVVPPRRDEETVTGTHFVTSAEWRSHLDIRGLPPGPVDAVVLSTDGLEPAAIEYVAPEENGERTPARARDVYLIPEILALVEEDGTGEDALREDLSAPRIMAMKGDDIGVAVAVREQGGGQRRRVDHPRPSRRER